MRTHTISPREPPPRQGGIQGEPYNLLIFCTRADELIIQLHSPHKYHFAVVDTLQIFARFFVVRRVLKCRKAIRSLPLSASLCAVLLLPSCTPLLTGIPLRQVRLPQAHLSQSPAPQYFSPLQNAEYVSRAATILVRYGPILSDHDIDGLKFQIQGSTSKDHAGRTILADDHKTVIFKPDDPFTPGEKSRSALAAWSWTRKPVIRPFPIPSPLRSTNSREHPEAVPWLRLRFPRNRRGAPSLTF